MKKDYYKSTTELVTRLVDAGMQASSFVGCSKAEIDRLESKYSCRLPVAYRAFLEIMGKSPGGRFFGDVIIAYKYIDQINDWANEVIRDEGYLMPERRYVFSSLMGQAYAFFNLDDDLDDPRFYTFHEDDGVVDMSPTSFMEMLEEQVDAFVLRLRKEKFR